MNKPLMGAELKLHLVELFVRNQVADPVLQAVSAYDWITDESAIEQSSAPAPIAAAEPDQAPAPVDQVEPEPAQEEPAPAIAVHRHTSPVLDAEPRAALDDDQVALALAVQPSSERAMAARDVPAGQSWAFREHRTLAEVEPAAAAPATLQVAIERDGRGRIVWTQALRDELARLAREGHDLEAIAAAFGGAKTTSMQAQISILGLTADWRAAQRRRAEAASVPTDDGGPQLPASVLASRAADKERQRQIEEFLRTRGVTTAVDFGPDQPAVDEMRAAGHIVARPNSQKRGRPGDFLVDGYVVKQEALWKRANKLRKERGLPPLTRAKEAA